jgi:chromosome segregation ATPase
MKREFLKDLGIEDKDVIDKILNENSIDIGKAKGEVDNLNQQITTLKGDISTKDKEINTLKSQVGDSTALNDKIKTLETENTDLKSKLNTEVSKLQKAHAIESGVRDAKAKNVKAVMALLDVEKITFENNELNGLSEQLEALKTGEDSSFLFGENLPAGTHQGTPNAGGGTPPTSKTLSEAISNALSNSK